MLGFIALDLSQLALGWTCPFTEGPCFSQDSLHYILLLPVSGSSPDPHPLLPKSGNSSTTVTSLETLCYYPWSLYAHHPWSHYK